MHHQFKNPEAVATAIQTAKLGDVLPVEGKKILRVWGNVKTKRYAEGEVSKFVPAHTDIYVGGYYPIFLNEKEEELVKQFLANEPPHINTPSGYSLWVSRNFVCITTPSGAMKVEKDSSTLSTDISSPFRGSGWIKGGYSPKEEEDFHKEIRLARGHDCPDEYKPLRSFMIDNCNYAVIGGVLKVRQYGIQHHVD